MIGRHSANHVGVPPPVVVFAAIMVLIVAGGAGISAASFASNFTTVGSDSATTATLTLGGTGAGGVLTLAPAPMTLPTPTPMPSPTIAVLKASPATYLGRVVRIQGMCRGWGAGYGPPPVTRSDWVLEDNTGAIYVTGSLPGVVVQRDTVKTVVVIAVVQAKGDTLYLTGLNAWVLPSTDKDKEKRQRTLKH